MLLLTGAFGRSFSKLELGISWLHPTELLLLAALAGALLRTPASQWRQRLGETGALVPLLILWVVGALAVARGLVDWGFTRVLYDVGLIEYSVLLPLIALVVRSRSELLWLSRVVVVAGLLAIVAMAASSWTPAAWELSSSLNLIAAASGMYATIFVAWVLAQRAAGLTVGSWQYLAAVLGGGLVVLGSARSAWLGLLVAFACVAVFSLRGRRLGLAAQMGAIVVLGTAVATAAERVQLLDLPSPSTAAAELVAGAEPDQPPPSRADEGRAAPDRAPEELPAPAITAARDSRDVEPLPDRVTVRSQPDSLYANPGIELGNVRGYASFSPNTVAASTERARSGAYSLQAIYNGDPRLAKTLTYLPLEAGRTYRASAWVYLPPTWDGGGVSISTDRTWADAVETTRGSATETTGRWTRIQTELEPHAGDLIGGIHIRTPPPPAPSPTPGSRVHIDNLTIEPIEPVAVAAPSASAAGAPEAPASGLGELTASFRESSPQLANARWRLAFWSHVVEEAARRPLWGVGFGAPSNFEWNGIRYDSRTGDAGDPFDVSGPHNSFLNVLYRTGLPGLLALAAVMLIAVGRLIPVARRAEGVDKAVAIWLLAGVAATTVAASFNVALEGPFMGVFFWAMLGLALVAPSFLGRTPAGGNGRGPATAT